MTNTPQPRRKRRRVGDGLIALGAIAVVSVYTAGYVQTRGANADFGAGFHVLPEDAAANYKDGTFTGRGASRHGGIEATVTVKNGKIAAVEVSSCETEYSCDRLDRLIGLVVS